MSSILFVTRNFPPLVGGMERLALAAVRALAEGAVVDLIGPKGAGRWFDGDCQEVAFESAGAFLVQSWLATRRATATARFDWVVGGSGLAAPAVRSGARRCGALSACFVHGLDLVVDSPPYRWLCLPAVRRMDLVIANSANTARLARGIGVEDDKIAILHPGVALVERVDPAPFLAAYPQAAGRQIVLSVGRLLPRKGVADFVLHSLPQVVAKHPDALFVVSGGHPRHALAGRASDDLTRVISHAGMERHVLLTGELSDRMRDALYAAGRVAVFPVKDIPGDVEGFGMVALEAAAHGLPTVAFAAGGVPDAVEDGVSGALVVPGDYRAMTAQVNRFLAGEGGSVSPETCRAFASRFAWPVFGERLRGLLSSPRP